VTVGCGEHQQTPTNSIKYMLGFADAHRNLRKKLDKYRPSVYICPSLTGWGVPGLLFIVWRIKVYGNYQPIGT